MAAAGYPVVGIDTLRYYWQHKSPEQSAADLSRLMQPTGFQGSGLIGGRAVIDGTGKWVTPGIIDVHSHLGVYPSPGASAHSDGNEATAPNTAQVWAEHSVWPQDPGFGAALAGGTAPLIATWLLTRFDNDWRTVAAYVLTTVVLSLTAAFMIRKRPVNIGG